MGEIRMSLNQKQFAEKCQVTTKTVMNWYKKGYLGKIEKSARGEYLIPDDTPIPYQANAKLKNDGKILFHILKAASKHKSFFSSMYPNIPKEVIDSNLDELIKGKYVKLIETSSGISYLVNLPNGTMFLQKLQHDKNDYILKTISTSLSTGISLTSLLINFLH